MEGQDLPPRPGFTGTRGSGSPLSRGAQPQPCPALCAPRGGCPAPVRAPMGRLRAPQCCTCTLPTHLHPTSPNLPSPRPVPLGHTHPHTPLPFQDLAPEQSWQRVRDKGHDISTPRLTKPPGALRCFSFPPAKSQITREPPWPQLFAQRPVVLGCREAGGAGTFGGTVAIPLCHPWPAASSSSPGGQDTLPSRRGSPSPPGCCLSPSLSRSTSAGLICALS